MDIDAGALGDAIDQGKPEPGPARRPVETVTMPGAASAAVGASSNAANNTLRNFMA